MLEPKSNDAESIDGADGIRYEESIAGILAAPNILCPVVMNSLRYIYQCLKCYRIVPTIRYYKYYLLSAVIISISFIVVIMFS